MQCRKRKALAHQIWCDKKHVCDVEAKSSINGIVVSKECGVFMNKVSEKLQMQYIYFLWLSILSGTEA
jgi:hypothetical protein